LILVRPIWKKVPVAVLSILLFGCARAPLQPPARPLSFQEISRTLDTLSKQENLVYTVYSLGQVTARTKEDSSQLNVLIVGTREPFRIKIELTHPWGRPVAHVLLHNERLSILAIPEKRLYVGQLDALSPGTFLPAGLGREQFWALVRSYPVLVEHHQQVSTQPDEIRLLDIDSQTIEVIHMDPYASRARRISFPRQGIDIHYSEYAHYQGILYAREVKLSDSVSETHFVFHFKEMVINQPVPEEVFRMDVPPDFERSPL